jgi:hypothetical protein
LNRTLIASAAFTRSGTASSADDAGQAWNLRCEVRKKMIDFLQREYPEALPRQRQVNFRADDQAAAAGTERPAAPDMPTTKPAARG